MINQTGNGAVIGRGLKCSIDQFNDCQDVFRGHRELLIPTQNPGSGRIMNPLPLMVTLDFSLFPVAIGEGNRKGFPKPLLSDGAFGAKDVERRDNLMGE